VTGQAIFEMLPREAIYAIPVAIIATLAVLLVRRVMLKRAMNSSTSVAKAYSTPVVEENVETIAHRIDAAQAAGDNAALADLYLALADAYKKRGDEKARMTALTSAAGCGALHGPHASHGSARMQLADLAYGAGDLTSACEHWHLARGAFQAGGQTEEHARVEKLMRDHGCPTDWVLTGF
jgi:hypothetical protein